jgi:hypothetical protein
MPSLPLTKEDFRFENQALSYPGPSRLITKQDALLAEAENSEETQNILVKITVFISSSYKVTSTLWPKLLPF